MQGNFSWGVNSFDKEERNKHQEEAKTKAAEELAKNSNWLQNFLNKHIYPASRKVYEIPYPPRSLKRIIGLKDIDLQVKKGEFVVIIGAIGSGKSSLLNTMIGEMIHVPNKEIDFIGDEKRELSSDEQKALENTLLAQKYEEGDSPV